MTRVSAFIKRLSILTLNKNKLTNGKAQNKNGYFYGTKI